MKKILFALVAAAALLVGCQPKPVLVSSIKLSETTLNMVEGDTQHISAIVSPKEATNPEVTWTSGNTSVATVTGSGDVTAVAPGEAKITVAATDGSGVTATCQVSVVKKVIPVSKIELNETAIRLKPAETFQLEAVITPSDATYNHPKWVSSDTKVATVENGKVTAVAPGTANITAEAADESGVKSAPCVVTVFEPKPMFVKFKNPTTRVGAAVNQAVWYGTVDKYGEREDVESPTMTSENPGVASVDGMKITGVAEGKTKVTITDGSGSSVSFDVTVIPACPTPLEYTHGIQLFDCSQITFDDGDKKGYFRKLKGGAGGSNIVLKDGFVEGTQRLGGTCEGNDYKILEAKFDNVDVSSVENPALFIRLYVDEPTNIFMNGAGEMELTSSGTSDNEELTFPWQYWNANAPAAFPDVKLVLKKGWNNIVVPFTMCDQYRKGGNLGAFRPKNVNYFRLFRDPSQRPNLPTINYTFDDVRVIDWTEFDPCDNLNIWLGSGQVDVVPCYVLDTKDKKQGAGCISVADYLHVGPIANLWIRAKGAGPYYAYSMPADMDESNAKLRFWFYVDDAAYYKNFHLRFETTTNVNDSQGYEHSWGPNELDLKDGWNLVEHDFNTPYASGKENWDIHNINYIRAVFTPQGSAATPNGFHTYKIDDIRIVKK